jgi:hypothetical protein
VRAEVRQFEHGLGNNWVLHSLITAEEWRVCDEENREIGRLSCDLGAAMVFCR